jgi:predicted transcriptional regulator
MTLKEWRDHGGRRVDWLAERLEVSRQAVHNYERGRLPPAITLEKIVRLTGGQVTPNDWFDFHELAPAAAGEPNHPGMCRRWISLLYAPQI